MVYQLSRIRFWFVGKRRVAVFSNKSSNVFACAPAEHDQVYQRIGAQAVSAMHRDASYLTGRIEARLGRPLRIDHDARIFIGWNSTHSIMRGRLDRHRLSNRFDAEVVTREVGNIR